MFNNRFNSTKKDSLVEAVQSAMQDGEIRRQAEALVNEEFGVYSRNAVVREQLAAYDARLEEAYKCMKEGEKLAKKDYDKDGKIESPKDEVWGSRFRAAKMAGKMEEEKSFNEMTPSEKLQWMKDQVQKGKDEKKRLRKSLREKPKKTVKEGMIDPKDPSVQGGGDVTTTPVKKTSMPRPTAPKTDSSVQRSGEVTSGGKPVSVREEEQIDERNLLKRMKDTMRLGSSGKERVDRISGALSDRGGNWDYKKGDFTEKGKSQVKSRLKNVKGASDYALNKEETQIDEVSAGLARRAAHHAFVKSDKMKADAKKEPDMHSYVQAFHKGENKSKQGTKFAKYAAKKMEESQVDEAAYSAKAARAGKDIGKPGKMFKKIAKKAGEKYGSEERGKKVAGAILKRIRAKHMKEENLEELSAFGRAFAAAKGQNFTFGGKQYSGARADGASRSSGPQNNPGLKSASGFQRTTITSKPAPSKTEPPNNAGLRGTNTPGALQGAKPFPTRDVATADTSKITALRSTPGGVIDRMRNIPAPVTNTKPSTGSGPQGAPGLKGPGASSMETGTKTAPQSSTLSVPKLAMPKLEMPKLAMPKLNESVQVGANKYRIV